MPMFNTSHLPPALLEFVVISDTHYMLDVGDQPLEFESRRKQTARAGAALAQVAALQPDVVIHLGDLVQEYPESPDFQRAIAEARQQIAGFGLAPNHVPGNHDVGDKSDPTMPTHPANAASLSWYHAQFGPSWYSFDHGPCHFIILNSQILSADLPETTAQWTWLESDLSANAYKRIFAFLHLPPYLHNPDEPGLGHYDNINPPARHRLLDLVCTHGVEWLAAGHVHYPFYDRIGATRYLVMPSPSFTRPGFGHLFASAPPPERGRDDTGKLGFYFFRVFSNRTDVHFIRTQGALTPPERTRLLTGTSRTLPDSPIGITLHGPLTSEGDVPQAWPSAVRQRVRNDLPYLSCLEPGATTVRLPHRDLRDPFQRERIAMLQSDGIRITATVLEPNLHALPDWMAAHPDITWEIQLPGQVLPPQDMCDILKQCPAPLSLCPIIPTERVPGKQHNRTRIGYRPDELVPLNKYLAQRDLPILRVLCRIPPDASPWDFARHLPTSFSHIAHIDLALELDALNDARNACRLAEAIFAIALRPGAHLFVDPLTDTDRTMDISHGLLDTLCNPRPAFHVLRCLNTLLFSPVHNRAYHPLDIKKSADCRALGLQTDGRSLALIFPEGESTCLPSDFLPNAASIYHLATGDIEPASNTPIQTGDFPILIA